MYNVTAIVTLRESKVPILEVEKWGSQWEITWPGSHHCWRQSYSESASQPLFWLPRRALGSWAEVTDGDAQADSGSSVSHSLRVCSDPLPTAFSITATCGCDVPCCSRQLSLQPLFYRTAFLMGINRFLKALEYSPTKTCVLLRFLFIELYRLKKLRLREV